MLRRWSLIDTTIEKLEKLDKIEKLEEYYFSILVTLSVYSGHFWTSFSNTTEKNIFCYEIHTDHACIATLKLIEPLVHTRLRKNIFLVPC